MQQNTLDILIQNELVIISSLITIIIALYSLYESLRNKRKFNQLNRESLISKVSIDFNYKTEKETDENKIVKGMITFKNMGTTNIKLIELNFDVKDRSDEIKSAFVPSKYVATDPNFTLEIQPLKSLNLIGFNNSKQLSFTNPSNKYFQVFRSDSAYVYPSNHSLRNFDMDKNINDYIVKKNDEVYNLFKNFDANKEKIIQLLIGNLLIREIRGFQLFPSEHMIQEFVASYSGSGTIILNVDTSSLRFLQRSIIKGEEFKLLVDQCMEAKTMTDELKVKMIDVLKDSLQPSSNEIVDYRKTFLMYLP